MKRLLFFLLIFLLVLYLLAPNTFYGISGGLSLISELIWRVWIILTDFIVVLIDLLTHSWLSAQASLDIAKALAMTLLICFFIWLFGPPIRRSRFWIWVTRR